MFKVKFKTNSYYIFNLKVNQDRERFILITQMNLFHKLFVRVDRGRRGAVAQG